MDHKNLIINAKLVQSLIAKQFPQWKNLSIKPIAHQGWDNCTFHLGNELLVRMPSKIEYVGQVEKEQLWLPMLAPFLPFPIPEPIALGEPDERYPWNWSIYRWLEGEAASYGYIDNLETFASDVARFLIALYSININRGPLPGAQNFYRGGLLINYNAETRKAISILKDKIDVVLATEIWETALITKYNEPPVWIHGDISPSNLLVYKGKLSAVIDFGQLAIGDPACDLMIAWTMFKGKSREIFRKSLSLDQSIWVRARAWTLWKFLIIAAGIVKANVVETSKAWHIIKEVLIEYKQSG